MILEPTLKAVDSPARRELDALWKAVRALTPLPSAGQLMSRTTSGWSVSNPRKVSTISASKKQIRFHGSRTGYAVGTGFVCDYLSDNCKQNGGQGVESWDFWRRLNGNELYWDTVITGQRLERSHSKDFDPSTLAFYKKHSGISNSAVDVWPVVFYTTEPKKSLTYHTIKVALLPTVSSPEIDRAYNEGSFSGGGVEFAKAHSPVRVGGIFSLGMLPAPHYLTPITDPLTGMPEKIPHTGPNASLRQWGFNEWNAAHPMRSIHEFGEQDCTKISVREGLIITLYGHSDTYAPMLGESRFQAIIEGFSPKSWRLNT